MEKAAAIADIRKKLTEGNIEAALQLLIEQLEPERQSMRDLSNRALQAKAQLEKTQRDEQEGVISFENSKVSYNQITRQIISLVDEWEDPESVRSTIGEARRKFTPKMIMVAATLLIFVGVISWQMLIRKEVDNTTHAFDNCPELQPEYFSVMVLPYRSLLNPKAVDSPHRPLATRLDRFKGEFAGDYRIEIFSKERPVPELDADAINSAEECRAELVIWGEYEHLRPNEERTIVTTNYKYLSAANNFEFTMLSLDDEFQVVGQGNSSSIPTRGLFVDTISNYSAIINRGDLSEELENQFRLLFGVSVMQSGQPKEAIAFLENTNTKDSTATLLQGMALAESHLKNGEEKAAKESYDQVLKTHPNYWFALNNRAMLYYKDGDYDTALETVDRKLQEDPDNVNALTVRGAVRIKTKQLLEAEVDLKKAEKLSEEDQDTEKKQYIQQKLDRLEEAKAAEKRRIIEAKRSLSSTNEDALNALTILAEANRNLGNYAEASAFASRILQRDTKNPRALAVQLETAAVRKDEQRVQKIQQEVQKLDTAVQRTILQDRPILKRVLPVIQD